MTTVGAVPRSLIRGAVFTILALSIAGAGFLMRSQKAAPPEEHPAGSVSKEPDRPASPARDAIESFIGVVLARESVEVASPLEARLAQVLVHLGDHVKSGATVATLGTAPLRQELAMAEASLRAAEAEQRRADSLLAEARRRRGRVDSLGEFVAEADRAAAELDEKLAVSAFEAARAHVDKETAGVQRLRETLASSELRAPFDGTVAARFQDPGVMVHPGTPIVRLIRSDDLWVRFAVPEKDRMGITAGTRVDVHLENLDFPVAAVVEQIAPEVDAASRMVFMEARLDVPAKLKGVVQSGLTCRVSLPGTARAETGGA